MKVNEVAKLAGISVRTLHHYDEIGLLKKRDQLTVMIETIDQTIAHMKGEIVMSSEERFAGFDFSRNPYEDEARKRWGDEAVDRSQAKLDRMSKEEQSAMGEEMNEIYRKLASVRRLDPGSEEAQEAIGLWCRFLNRFADDSPEALKGLGQMYVVDERFTRNIDQFGSGLARFMRDAMAIYAERME